MNTETKFTHAVMFQGLLLGWFEDEQKAKEFRKKFLEENRDGFQTNGLILTVRPDLVIVIRD